MKKITLSMVVLLGLMACSSSNDETVAVARDGQPANEVVEYVWHSKGVNYSEESFALVVDKWNDLIDAQAYKMNGANILTPLIEVEGYDFIWVMLWPSMDARNAAWDHWMTNVDSEWQDAIEGVMSFNLNNVFAFEPTVMRNASVPNQTDTFENEFNFCDFNEGFGSNDLEIFQAEFADFLDETEVRDGPDGYWYVMMNPLFEGTAEAPLNDYLWLSLWTDMEEKMTGYENYASSDLAAKADKFSTCRRVSFSGKAIR